MQATERIGPGFWLTALRVYRKDLLLEWKSPIGLLATLVFALILATIYHFSLDDNIFKDSSNLTGLMLATLFFAVTISAGRASQADLEAGSQHQALLSPGDNSGYYIGKVASLWQIQLGFILIFVPMYQLLLTGRFASNIESYLQPYFVLSGSALSLACLGILLAGVSRANRLKELILPLILLPVSLPVLMIAANLLSSGDFSTIKIIALLAPAGLYGGLGALIYFIIADDGN